MVPVVIVGTRRLVGVEEEQWLHDEREDEGKRPKENQRGTDQDGTERNHIRGMNTFERNCVDRFNQT